MNVSTRALDVLLVCQQPALRNFWYPIARADTCVSRPVARTVLGTELMIEPVDPGPDRPVRCAGSDGAAVRAELRSGWVWACLGTPTEPIPDVPRSSGRWRLVHEPETLWACSAPHLVDNNLDPAHIAFVHRGSFGTPTRPEVPVADVSRTTTTLTQSYAIDVESRPGETGRTTRMTSKVVHLPFLMVTRIDYPDGVGHIMVKACTPVDDSHTRQLQMVLRTDTEADRPAEEIIAFDQQVWSEDRRVLETTWPDYHLDLTANVHLKTDRASIEYRRALRDLLQRSAP